MIGVLVSGQGSNLQAQMYAGADRYGTFGFLAYMVEPDFAEHAEVAERLAQGR